MRVNARRHESFREMKREQVFFYMRQSFEAYLLAKHFDEDTESPDWTITDEDRKAWAKMAKKYAKQFKWGP